MPEVTLEACQQVLNQAWQYILGCVAQPPIPDFTDEPELIAAITRSINSKTKSYRYVLPTQLVAKIANPALDARCLQAARRGAGSFDARTIAHQVVVPFDRANESVLGGSPEPYVNNPLRVPEISSKHIKAQKDRAGWQDLCTVLNEVETRGDSEFTGLLLRQVLKCVHARLAQVQIVYPLPNRISLERCAWLVRDFLAVPSGGDRFLAVTAAIFVTLGKRFRIFESLRRSRITAADAAAGMLADMECIDAEGRIVFVVEAKDRELTITQLQDKIPGLRAKRVSEGIFRRRARDCPLR